MSSIRIPFAYSLVLLITPALLAQDISQIELRKFTEAAIQNQRVKVVPPELDWSGDRLLVNSLGYANISRGVFDAPLEAALECQFTVTIIRLYRNSDAQKQFWEPVLKNAESQIQQILEVRSQKSISPEVREERISELTSAFHEEIIRSLEDLARRNGKKGLAAAAPWQQYRISWVTVPPGGEVAYMDSGLWELYHFLQKQGKTLEAPQWNSLLSEQADLGGMYWFKVNWPDGTQKFWKLEITKNDQKLTFSK